MRLRYPITVHARFRPDGEEVQKIEPTQETLVALGYFYPDIEGSAEQVQVVIDFLHRHEYVSMYEAEKALSSSKWYQEFESHIVEKAQNEMWKADISKPESFRNALKDVALHHFTPEMQGERTHEYEKRF